MQILFAFYFSLFHLLNMYEEEFLCDLFFRFELFLQCCRVGGRQLWRHFRGHLWRWENGMELALSFSKTLFVFVIPFTKLYLTPHYFFRL